MGTGLDKLLTRGNTTRRRQAGRANTAEQVKPVVAKRGTDTHLGHMTRIATQQDAPTEKDIVEIDPNLIDFSEEINHREQSWLSEDNKSFSKLMQSIELTGQQMPIMVRPKDGGRYELVYGSRRRQATLNLGINVKAIVARNITDDEAHTLALLENTNHSGLSPIEEARAVLALKERSADTSNKEIGIIFAKSGQWVGNQNSFAKLDDAFIDSCSNPWTITERATRQFRATWANNKSKRESWQKKLAAMRSKDEQLPFRQLLERLVTSSSELSAVEIKTNKGEVVAEVMPPKKRAGETVRTIHLRQSFDKKHAQKIIATLHEDFAADFE